MDTEYAPTTGQRHERRSSAVRVPPLAESVRAVRAEVARAACALQVPPDRVDDLVVAVSEACTNAIEAQAAAGRTDPIEVRCLPDGGVLAVEVEDHGNGFDPGALVPRPPLGDPGHLQVERGWGIQLMRELVDRLEYRISETGSVARLEIDLRDHRPAG